jgi:uncharacterized membrane protein YdjX (TVP38/TMEM64 family)
LIHGSDCHEATGEDAVKLYAAILCLGMSLGLFLARFIGELETGLRKWLIWNMSLAVLLIIASAALFAWAWKSR